MFLFTTLSIILVVLSAIILTIGAVGATTMALVFGDVIVFGLIIWFIAKRLIEKK